VNTGNWRNVLEAIGIAAVVVSLVFVGIQLRLDRAVARSELTSESFQIVGSLRDKLTDPTFAITYTMMLENPRDLSFAERLQIDNFYHQVVGAYVRECYLAGRGITGECDAIFQVTIRHFFSNEYAKAWWRLNGPPGNENDELFPFPNWVAPAIEGLDSGAYRQHVLDTYPEN
jgi:hypothetical protein